MCSERWRNNCIETNSSPGCDSIKFNGITPGMSLAHWGVYSVERLCKFPQAALTMHVNSKPEHTPYCSPGAPLSTGRPFYQIMWWFCDANKRLRCDHNSLEIYNSIWCQVLGGKRQLNYACAFSNPQKRHNKLSLHTRPEERKAYQGHSSVYIWGTSLLWF